MTEKPAEENESAAPVADAERDAQVPSAADDSATAHRQSEPAEDQNVTASSSASAQAHTAEDDLSLEEQMAKYKWYKCKADPATYGDGYFYYTQTETGESSWTEPTEPYWIWSTEAGCIDQTAGLQYPSQASLAQTSQQQATSDAYQGYNPKIHGNYDPNADYAKYHTRRYDVQDTAFDPNVVAQAAVPDPATQYASTMTLNRFSGRTQTGDRGPERHSDAAKSARQLNAFFDVDAAANAHDGRSLKAERREQRLTKQQIKEFNAKRAEKKHKKRMQQLLS